MTPIPEPALASADDVALAAWAKALAHPARVQILRTLGARGTCLCGEVVEAMPLAQATVSQHLKVLKEAGLVRGETDGPRSCYCLDAAALAAAAGALAGLFSDLTPRACPANDCGCS